MPTQSHHCQLLHLHNSVTQKVHLGTKGPKGAKRNFWSQRQYRRLQNKLDVPLCRLSS